MKTLVTGASGFIAQQLILDLLEQGHDVRGTVRSLAKGDTLRSALRPHTSRADEIELVEADLESDAGWAEAVAGVDAIHHVASPFPLAVPKNRDDLIRPAREGTLRVLRAAHAAGVQRVILTSSCAAIAYGWGDRLPEVLTEKDWSDADNHADCPPYPASKTLAEKAAWDFVADEGKGLQLTAINPVGVYGPVLSDQVRASVGIVADLLAGKFPALPDVGVQLVDVRDVSAAHVAAMNDPASIGERYIVADAYRSMADISRVLREAHPDRARKLPTRRLPDFLVRLLALFNGDMKTIAGELGRRRFASPEKVKKLLGRELIPADDAVRATAQTLIQYGAA
ncbi:MAG: aldehyde reductase [Myxococcota bacterium]|nr:aldehyde reductase [Myxococcota bacterium]